MLTFCHNFPLICTIVKSLTIVKQDNYLRVLRHTGLTRRGRDCGKDGETVENGAFGAPVGH